MQEKHDPRRPSLSTAQAADRLGMSRQAVVQAIHRGAIEGYGIAGDSRTRWFVPIDVVEAREAAAGGIHGELARLRARNRQLEEAMATLREAGEHKNRAEVHMLESRTLDRQARDRADQAWAEFAHAASTLEGFVSRVSVPANVEDV